MQFSGRKLNSSVTVYFNNFSTYELEISSVRSSTSKSDHKPRRLNNLIQAIT